MYILGIQPCHFLNECMLRCGSRAACNFTHSVTGSKDRLHIPIHNWNIYPHTEWKKGVVSIHLSTIKLTSIRILNMSTEKRPLSRFLGIITFYAVLLFMAERCRFTTNSDSPAQSLARRITMRHCLNLAAT